MFHLCYMLSKQNDFTLSLTPLCFQSALLPVVQPRHTPRLITPSSCLHHPAGHTSLYTGPVWIVYSALDQGEAMPESGRRVQGCHTNSTSLEGMLWWLGNWRKQRSRIPKRLNTEWQRNHKALGNKKTNMW